MTGFATELGQIADVGEPPAGVLRLADDVRQGKLKVGETVAGRLEHCHQMRCRHRAWIGEPCSPAQLMDLTLRRVGVELTQAGEPFDELRADRGFLAPIKG